MTDLNAGSGCCTPSHRLSIRPVRAVVDLGALPDVMHTVLNAAHHANRHGAVDDRIAIALPRLHQHRGVARPGSEVVLFGSVAALANLIRLEGIAVLVRRSMVKKLEIVEHSRTQGDLGTAYVRDRQAARRSPGAIRRARERAARRGIVMRDTIDACAPDRTLSALFFGDAVVHVREVAGTTSVQPLTIGTYGFSSASAPGVLPILPDRATRTFGDAA